MQSLVLTVRISDENPMEILSFGGFCRLIFKWTYLGAQVELVGEMVVATHYFEPVLHAEHVFGVIGSRQT